MRRFGNKHITMMAVAGILILLAAGSQQAWAGSQEAAREASERKAADQRDAVVSKASPTVDEDGPGFKGFALTLDRTGGDQSVNLKTSVLVKPLKTDHFYVAFGASAPLLKNNGSSNTDLYGADFSGAWEQDFQAFHVQHGTDTGSVWLVMADWPQADRLLPTDGEMNFNRLSEMNTDRGWNSKMELIFLPADQWTVRAILSMAHDAPEHRRSLSTREALPARVGMAIDVDYQIYKSIALGFDYGHYRYGRTFMDATGDTEMSPDELNSDGPVRSDNFTARLTIRF